jgi:diacylglycerol kinase (ATP)
VEPLLLISNADAGSAADATMQVALAVLRERTDVEVATTANPGELDGVLHRAGSRRIVVAGGDGSLHAVVAALHRRHDLDGRTLGLLPLGTGNDFARSAGIPLDVTEAANLVLDGSARPMDLVVDELGEVVVNNVHLGASALASRRGADWKSVLGLVGYPVGVLLTALRPPAVRVRVEADGVVIADMDRPVLMVAVGNGASVGGGAQVTPLADPGDGELDVLVSFATSPVARVGYVANLLRGSHHQRDDVVSCRAKQVSVSGEDFWLSADGEISGPERRRTWHVEPAAYSLLS